MKNSDKDNARVEHDRALARAMTAVLKDDTELFKQFADNEGFPALADRYGVSDDLRGGVETQAGEQAV